MPWRSHQVLELDPSTKSLSLLGQLPSSNFSGAGYASSHPHAMPPHLARAPLQRGAQRQRRPQREARELLSLKTLRHIPSAPTRILDAPGLLDDYYLNLVAWSARNIIAVALGPAVYLWDAKSGTIDELMALEDESDYVCSLKFIPGGTHLAVGTATANTPQCQVAPRLAMMDTHSA